jgi:hypothetical protein
MKIQYAPDLFPNIMFPRLRLEEDWTGEFNWVIPPVGLIGQALLYMLTTGAEGILWCSRVEGIPSLSLRFWLMNRADGCPLSQFLSVSRWGHLFSPRIASLIRFSGPPFSSFLFLRIRP